MKIAFTERELDIMAVLWEHGPSTAAEVRERLEDALAYNTVLTLLSRLRDKGYVAADRRDTAHLFRAVVTRDELLGSTLAALADRVCDGTASPLVLALVRGKRFSADEIAHFRKLLDDLTPRSARDKD